MGAIRKYEGKRGVSWTIDYITPEGKRVRQSFKTRKQAAAELTARDYTIQQGTYTDPQKYQKFTLEKLCDDYIQVHQTQSSFKTVKKHLIKQIREYFGDTHLLINVTYRDLELYRAHMEQTPNKYGNPRKTATINRTLSCLRHMFRKAVEWDLLRQNPFDSGGRLHKKENNMVLRFLSEDEIINLLAQCTGNQGYLHDIVTCAINTGMRKTELLTLKWSQVRNGQLYLVGKGDKPREVPIVEDLEQLFKGIRKRQGLSSQYVFTRRGKPIVTSIDASFKAALKRGGILNCKFHTLRHTFSSHFVMRGGDLKSLQEILGHSDIATTMRYAHLSKAHKAKAINLVCGLTSPSKNSKSGDVPSTVFDTIPRLADRV
jgi:site-specific recombinase XerD